MLEYDRIDISEGIDINKTNATKKCDIFHYWYFLDKNFDYESYLCNFNDVAIVFIEGNDYRTHFWFISKDDAISIMNNSS